MSVQLPPHLSYSSKSAYVTCGERFRLEKVEAVPSRPSWAMVGGSAMHTLTETLDRQLFGEHAEAGTLDFDQVFDAQIASQVERCGYQPADWNVTGKASKANPNKEDEAWWRVNGPVFVQNWVNWRDRTGWNIWLLPDDSPAIELSLNPSFGGIPIKMFIDRVFVTPEGELVVVDLKSGSRTPDPSQLGTYAAGMEQFFGAAGRPQYGAYWLARAGGTSPLMDLDSYTQERLGYEYSTARKGMEAGIFLPNVGMLCGGCGVRDACYAVGGVNSADYKPYGFDKNVNVGDNETSTKEVGA